VRADGALSGVLLLQGRIVEAWEITARCLELARELNDPELLFSTALAFIGRVRSRGERAKSWS
jgi:hypothetical protein